MEPFNIEAHLHAIITGVYKGHYYQKQRFLDYVELFHVKHHRKIHLHHINNVYENRI